MYITLIIILLFLGLLGLFSGLIFGLILIDHQLPTALKVIAKSFVRVTKKKWLRVKNPEFNITKFRKDWNFINLPDEKKTSFVDTKALDAVTELKLRLVSKFGSQIKEIYLFGSRVRGDFESDSDVDVGVFISESCVCSADLERELISQTSQLLLKYGLFLQPRIIRKKVDGDFDLTNGNYLAQIVIGYGISV